MDKKKFLGFYDYTVVLTYMGMLFAFTGILSAIKLDFVHSMTCLMTAGICDMFDGAVASTKERNCYEKHFGIEIDSMSDLISFGVLPALFVYMIYDKAFMAGIVASVYVLCALIRLSYFNVQELDRQKKTTGKREFYLGVPVTTVAILLPLMFLIKSQLGLRGKLSYIVLLLIMACGFISGIEIKKPKLVGKIIMIALGLLEFIGIFLLSGADIM
ncbi:CDP-alcohol phosphatidyltransferase family protein [Oribacterium sp. WCC10]|uniref:CDP-alcohol phosphatidyltransferase family protein n=1 Tax=Oribacterium sp. WCC10 TaxID=1855343 RepID=UPI0008E79845|nr:CDP-alcohol phosphatidyltransferase family protein [Oribacterium sp. WCC10]SFG20761.1 CDP-diacylglycerol---serine O-phosphatidyltransferase [Oribacterium sp. WCC10]